MTREDAHIAATVAITIIFGIIVGVVVAIVLSSLLTVEAMAPTAAEVMAVITLEPGTGYIDVTAAIQTGAFTPRGM